MRGTSIKRRSSGVVAAIVAVGTLLLTASPARADDVLSPSSPSFAYDAGPFTNGNVAGVLGFGCEVPEGCHTHPFSVELPAGYYTAIRNQGKIGVVRIGLTWEDNADDFDVSLLDAEGNTIATGGFGNSDFERIEFAELPSGTYTIQVAIFRAVNAAFHVDVSLRTIDPAPTTAESGVAGLSLATRVAPAPADQLAFSNGTPVTLERSSGEPNMEVAPDGALYVDFPLSIPNGILLKSSDDGDTWRPLQPLHPSQSPLAENPPIGGGDTLTTFAPDGRFCYSELNTLTSLGVACSTDGGKTFGLSTLIADPETPIVDRQWMATTPNGDQYVAAQFGIVTAGVSRPGIVVFKEALGTSVFTKVLSIDTGKAMKSYNMAADPTDVDANGGTVVQTYLRTNEGPDALEKPHQLVVWQTTDGGATAKSYVVANLATTPGNNFASVDVDRGGNVYVAWSEQGTWDIFYSVARKGDLEHFSEPIRVNDDILAATAIQPTIKAGDPGRVFIGYHAAQQVGNPDALAGAEWHAYVSWSLNGTCHIDAPACTAPSFRQVRMTEHPLQFRGVCLGGTGCAGDDYYGDRSMLEFLDLAISPETGRIFAVTTDSSRENRGTTITSFKQISGPSAYAGAPPIRDVTRVTDRVTDASGDAGWPYESVVATTPTPGADLTSVAVSRPAKGSLRVTMTVADPKGFVDALNAGAGNELTIGTRFATNNDVLWVGIQTLGADPTFVAGHLSPNRLVFSYFDAYEVEDVEVTGSIDETTGVITIDIPNDALETTLDQPETVETDHKKVPALTDDSVLYAITGFAFVALNNSNDEFPKHLLDVTPAFTYAPASVLNATSRVPAESPGSAAPRRPRPALPATGVGDVGYGVALIAFAGALAIWRRRRLPG